MPTTIRRLQGDGYSKNIRLDFISNPKKTNLDQNLTFWISFWKETTDLIFKILLKFLFRNLWCTHGSSDHLINGTDNRPIQFIWQSKAFRRKKSFTYIVMKVSNYVDSDK